MEKKRFFIFLFLILLASSLLSGLSHQREDGVDIKFKVINYGVFPNDYTVIPENYHIVGDFFAYEIFFETNQDVSDTIFIKITDPNEEIIHKTTHQLDLTKGENESFIPHGLKGDDIIALPFNLEGDYMIEVCSSNDLIFYRPFTKLYTSHSGISSSVWQSPCTQYFFGVMSQSDYYVNKEQKEQIERNINQSNIMIKFTKWIFSLTIILFLFGTIQLFSTRGGRNAFFSFLSLIPILIIFLFSGMSFWLTLEFEGVWRGTIFIMGLLLLVWGVRSFNKVLKEIKKRFTS